MPQKIFKRVGLRRDKNFSDLRDRKGALNNLLDTIVDGSNPDGTPNTFISEDLDAIRNLFAEGMSNGNYLQFVNSAVEFTDQNGQNRKLQPRSTYQNRLDVFESFSGNPRLKGGDGLTARYFNSDQIQDKKSTSIHALPVDDIFVGVSTGGELPSDQLWDNGDFQYTGKIHPSSVNANGGVKWEGFFIPTVTAKHSFNVSSSGSFTFDFQDPSYTVGVNTYREYMRVSGITTSSCTAAAVGNTLTLEVPDEGRFIGHGMNVSCDQPSIIRPGTKVDSVSSETVVLINPDGDAVTEAFASVGKDIIFSRDVGVDIASKTATTQVLEAGERYRIRARFYIPPTIDSQRIDRNIEFDFALFGGSFQNLEFTQLYNLNYDFSESAKGGFIDFLDNSVGFGGGTLGGTTNSNDYVEVRSTKKIDIKYEPKTSFSAINVQTYNSASWETGRTIITPNGNTTNVEVGNYVFGIGIPNNTRVKEVRTNDFIIIDTPASAGSAGSQIVIVDHRGFVKRIAGCDNSSSGDLSTSVDMAGDFLAPANPTNSHGDVTISRTSGQTGVLTLTNVTDGTSANYTFSDSFTTIQSNQFTAGKQYTIQVSTSMDLQFVMNGAGGGDGGGAGGKLDATIRVNSADIHTLIIGVKGRDPGSEVADYTGFSEATRLIMGGGGSGFNGGYSGGGFTGLFQTTTITATALFNAAVLVAGGGGGKGVTNSGGGAGGGTTGSQGSGSDSGQGGTQTTGGQGGLQGSNVGGSPGTQLLGGHGANVFAGGGGGGGGYYGGGAGRGDTNSNPGGLPGGGGSGFIDQTKGASSAVKFDDIDTGMLVITSGSDVPAYTRVIQTVSDTQVRINLNSAFTGRDAYFYQSRGLINKSLDTFCVPAPGNTIICKLIDADASSGAVRLTLADSTGVVVGQTVTGFGIQTGTTITNIIGIDNIITLSLALDANIKAGATVTIASAAEGDKSLCCPPTDTSPPFEPTNEGLKTPTANPDLIINQGNLIFDNLIATVNENDYTFPRIADGNGITVNNFSDYVIGERAENFLPINTGVDFSNPNSGTTYRILMDRVFD